QRLAGRFPLPIAPELAQRLQNYRIDERARDRLRRLAPIVEPVLGPAIDQVISGATTLSSVSELWQRHGADIRRVEMGQFQALLRAEFDPAYYETCRATVEVEAGIGFEGGARLNCAASIIQLASQAIARESWFGGRGRIASLSQAVMFDLATTAGLFIQFRERAEEARR